MSLDLQATRLKTTKSKRRSDFVSCESSGKSSWNHSDTTTETVGHFRLQASAGETVGGCVDGGESLPPLSPSARGICCLLDAASDASVILCQRYNERGALSKTFTKFLCRKCHTNGQTAGFLALISDAILVV